MTEIIPSINHPDPAEIRRRIKLVEPYVSWVHVDVSDGIFTSQKFFNDPEALVGFETTAQMELHLMTDKPEAYLDAWLRTPAARFWIHVESTAAFDDIRERLAREGREIGCALRPETSAAAFAPYATACNYVMALGVDPGPSGQQMQPHIIEKISTLRKAHPDAIIEVDGGVSLALGTAKKCVEARADILVVGHEIFSSPDIPHAIEKFRNL